MPTSKALQYARNRGAASERVVILGAGPVARQLAATLELQDPGSVVGFVVEQDGVAPVGEVPVIGRLEELPRILTLARPDRVVVALTEWRNRLPVQDLLQCSADGVDVETASQAYERLTGKLAIESLPPSYLVFSGAFRRRPALEGTIRGISLVLAIVGAILALPLMLAVALLIKLDSRGPVLFVQERIGLRGRRFPLFKFRTMHPADDATSEWVCDNTERITRVGEWIRKFRLDELPQFLNVIRGDMNFVGPRPHPVSNYELFSKSIPYYSLRASVRPGITGWAQVRNGYANNLDEETEKMRYDLYYIRNRSLWLDLKILIQTVRVVLFGQKHGHEVPLPVDVPPSEARPAASVARASHGPLSIGAKVAALRGKRLSA